MMNREIFFTKTGNSIYNDEIRIFLEKNIGSYFTQKNFATMHETDTYCDFFREWILSSKLNKVKGLESFPISEVSLGVTQSLDAFHYEILKNGRKLRLFRGEYPYNRDVHSFDVYRDFIDDRPLNEGDAIIVSCPFSGNGMVHTKMQKVFIDAETLNIPVFVDLAWFGTCAQMNIDLSSPSIKYVAFSLTKGLTCGNYRAGIRFSRNKEPKSTWDRISLQHEWRHGIHLNTFIGLQLMKTFSPDFHYLKYRPFQEIICDKFGLQASLCAHIAIGDETWSEFSRDQVFNRVNIREAIKKFNKL